MPNRVVLWLATVFPCCLPVLAAGAAVAGDPIVVEVVEGLDEKWSWPLPSAKPSESFEVPALGLVRLPTKYTPGGVEADRKGPIALHASAVLKTVPGPYRLLLRSRHAAQLLVDGKVVAETRPISRNSAGHEPVPPEYVPEDPRWHALPSGAQERLVEQIGDGAEHRIELWAIVGGKGLRNETGEILAAVVAPGEVPRLIGGDVPLTDSGWEAFVERESARLVALDSDRRHRAASLDDAYWAGRHKMARRLAAAVSPQIPPGASNLIDRGLGTESCPLADDAAFFRRLSLDTIGVIPEPAEVSAFLADSSPDKRDEAIEARLADSRWADGWMGYWQDVLAENPGLLKPTLNNTGPFRRYLHDALADNMAIDRFVTTLVRMEGSTLGGGPAGFGMATQNDAPMAAKAHVLAKAFLAAEMKCARCHDAPFRPYDQADLFGLAALLSGKPQAIPATSTVPRQPGGRVPAISISLQAGEAVEPAWSLTEIAPLKLPEGLVSGKASPRERLAALITSPTNQRFAPVVVNRLWHRYLGFGLVEPVDDWDGDPRRRNPEVLADLARELVTHDYDLKHVARLIFRSHAYQARTGGAGASARRMSAEQVLDSLFAAVGKPFRAEELCLDIDGRRPPSEFLNLGRPRRAWQLALPSNERDRPALTLPVVSSLTDALLAFGWRAARPDPITVREESITPLQPAQLANGLVVDGRIARLSDDSAITELCLKTQPADDLIRAVVLRVLSRPATEAEVARLVAYLGDTYAARVVPGVAPQPPMRSSARRVSWSNHLHPDATTIQEEEERVVRRGDPPTGRLTTAFRERMEDVVWALINSPEFVFLP
jgi:Protein of unknown function (DUF1553)/Protein of unknown function (DUF1549)